MSTGRTTTRDAEVGVPRPNAQRSSGEEKSRNVMPMPKMDQGQSPKAAETGKKLRTVLQRSLSSADVLQTTRKMVTEYACPIHSCCTVTDVATSYCRLSAHVLKNQCPRRQNDSCVTVFHVLYCRVSIPKCLSKVAPKVPSSISVAHVVGTAFHVALACNTSGALCGPNGALRKRFQDE